MPFLREKFFTDSLFRELVHFLTYKKRKEKMIKILKKKSLLFLFVTLLIFFICCSSSNNDDLGMSIDNHELMGENDDNNTSGDEALNSKMIEFVPNSEHVRMLGRSFFTNELVFMGYSSTGVEFSVNAKKLSVKMIGDSTTCGLDKGSAPRIIAFVNGERKLDQMLINPKQEFVIFEDNQAIDGIVQILKVSECSVSLAGIESICTDEGGSVSATFPRELKIEFIGDSITCGYGVDDPIIENHFKSSTEDSTKTYAYKTAAALNADYSMVSISGWGIISGCTGNGVKDESSQIPKVYDKLVYTWGATLGDFCPKDINWNFLLFQPDVVVINLGTNDASYTRYESDRIQEYIDAYVEFLKDVRMKNARAYIICSLGMMGQDLYPAIEAAVTKYKSVSDDEYICALKFDNQSVEDGICADGHPSEKTHAKAAEKLITKIKEIL